jgi:hypothetical protein
MASLADAVSGLFTQEWQRFADGVARLDPDSYASVRDAIERQRLPAEYRNIVSIPGWDDVIQLAPRAPITREEWQESRAARREGREPRLPPERVEELRRREDLRRRIAGAPDAPTAASWGRILTALDNVQDFLSTIGTFGRVALWAAPRVFGRFVPVVGVVLVAGDVLNLLGLLGSLATPLWALLCQGPSAALAAGVPSVLFKRALKAEAWRGAFTSPWGRFAELRTPATSLRSILTVGKLLEVAQTTQALWGVGLSLGAVVGLVTQPAAAAAAAARGEPVNVQRNALSDALTRLINRPLAEDPRPLIEAEAQAAHVMAMAPALLARPDLLGEAGVLMTATAALEAARIWYQRLRPYDWRPLLDAALDAEWAAPVLRRATVGIAPELGWEDPADAPRWDLPGAPERATGRAVADYYAATVPAALDAWLRPRRQRAVATYLGAVASTYVETVWPHLTGDPEPLRWRLAPDWALASAIAESGVLPIADEDGTRAWAAWREAREVHERAPRRLQEPEWWRALWERHGLRWARLLPPTAPWPDAWREWLASPEGEAARRRAETPLAPPR